MGYGMASNIRKKLSSRSTMFINDVNSEACDRFVNEHQSYGPVEIVRTAKEAASRAPILVSIVPAAEHVRQVYLDKENGVIAAPQSRERLILESSTIDVDSQREVGKAVIDAGVGSYYDAPVSVSFRSISYTITSTADLDRAVNGEQQPVPLLS